MGMKIVGCKGTAKGKMDTFVFQFVCLFVFNILREKRAEMWGRSPRSHWGPCILWPSAHPEWFNVKGGSQGPGLTLPLTCHALWEKHLIFLSLSSLLCNTKGLTRSLLKLVTGQTFYGLLPMVHIYEKYSFGGLLIDIFYYTFQYARGF